MIAIYHILTTMLLLIAVPVLPIVWLVSEKRRANLLQRLGFFTGFMPKKPGEKRIWVHALSVGEVNSALSFVTGLKKNKPGAQILFTASTRTGFETALRLMDPDKEGSPVSVLGYFPFDVWICVVAVMVKIRPDLVCLVETDLWPGFLSIMKKCRIPVILVNARLSSRSLSGYKRLGPFSALFFSALSHIMAQTAKDARGFERLGVPKDRISVTGNMKFDRPAGDISGEERKALEKKLGIRPGQPVWIAGSTHRGEEAILVEAFSRVRTVCPELKLILAPRDPKRSSRLLRDLPMGNFTGACFSNGSSEKFEADILFIDTMGELAKAYAASDLAFVGGSLVPRGGHNPLEPAVFGKPVLFGPHMTDFREMERLLLQDRGAVRVTGGEDLAKRVVALLGNPGESKRMGLAAQAVFYGNCGALSRIFETMEGGSFV